MAREEVYKRLREIDTSNFNSSSEVEAYMDGYIDCSKWAVSAMIEKACEWLQHNVYRFYWTNCTQQEHGVYIDKLLEQFRNAMEEL